MDDKRFSPLAFMITFFSTSLCSLLFTLLLLTVTGVISKNSTPLQQIGLSPVSMVLLGWIPGLVVNIFAYTILWLMKNRLKKPPMLIIAFIGVTALIISPLIEVFFIFLVTNGNH